MTVPDRFEADCTDGVFGPVSTTAERRDDRLAVETDGRESTRTGSAAGPAVARHLDHRRSRLRSGSGGGDVDIDAETESGVRR